MTEKPSVAAGVLRAAIAASVVVALSEEAASAVHKCVAPGGTSKQECDAKVGELLRRRPDAG